MTDVLQIVDSTLAVADQVVQTVEVGYIAQTVAQGGGAVTSVNGHTGVVVLGNADVGADTSGAAASALVTAEAYTDTAVAGRVPTSRLVSSGTGLTGGGDLSANRTLAVSYGSSAGTSAQGNDSRITGAIQSSLVTTKGDLLVATASGVVARHAVGSDGQALVADSSQTDGVRWATQDPNPIFPLSGYGLLAASGDPLSFLAQANTITNNLWYARVWVPAGVAITNLWAACVTAGTWDTTSTPNQLAVFADDGQTKLGSTADSGSLWSATGWRGGAVVGGPIVAQSSGRFVYVGWCSRGQGGGHAMQFASTLGTALPALQVGPSTTRRRAFFTGANSSGFPATFDPTSYATATNFVPLVGIS